MSNMVLMYGTPPDMDSPRFPKREPLMPSPVTQPMPGVQAMPPVTHNPFTGEPVNLLEVLAQSALLTDENKRLKEQISEMEKLLVARTEELQATIKSHLGEIRQLQEMRKIDIGTISVLETKVKALEFQREQKKLKAKKRK